MAVIGGSTESLTHPKYWNMVACTDTETGHYAGATFLEMGNNSTWVTQLDSYGYGATQQTASKTADTYYTYVDISGSHGALGPIILPQTSVNSTDVFFTIKLTTDGVEEEIKTRVMGTMYASYRCFYGPYGNAPNDTTAATRVDPVATRSGRYMYYFNGAYTGIPDISGKMLIMPIHVCQNEGIPVHPYTTSLKVEVKCSHVGAPYSGRYYESYGGVIYTATPNI